MTYLLLIQRHYSFFSTRSTKAICSYLLSVFNSIHSIPAVNKDVFPDAAWLLLLYMTIVGFIHSCKIQVPFLVRFHSWSIVTDLASDYRLMAPNLQSPPRSLLSRLCLVRLSAQRPISSMLQHLSSVFLVLLCQTSRRLQSTLSTR